MADEVLAALEGRGGLLDGGEGAGLSAWNAHLLAFRLQVQETLHSETYGAPPAGPEKGPQAGPRHDGDIHDGGVERHTFPDDGPGRPEAPGPKVQVSDEPQGVVFDPSVNQAAVAVGGIGIANGDTFKLHSLPSSPFRIYLDFDGHTTSGTAWNNDPIWGANHYAPAFSMDTSEAFIETELARIQQIWARVAEYFSPFNIDVTTEDPGASGLTKTSGDTDGYGIRVVITDEYDANKAWGGIAYVGVFGNAYYSPAFVYSQRLGDSAKNIADAIAHEAGHNLGLSHDGRTLSTGTESYYYGHGSGATDWAPIMGVGYNANIVQWSKGEYYQANQTQDDLAIITSSSNGFGYRTDDYGNSYATAALLNATVNAGVATVNTYGVISGSGTNNDVDMFTFAVTAGGSINFTVTDYTRAYVSGSSTALFSESSFSMLDVKLTLFDGNFAQVAVADDVTRIDATLSVTGLAGGTYYLAVDGTGWGTPTSTTMTGYTEYGSLGQYRISGTYTAGAVQQPVALSASKGTLATSESGTVDSVIITAVGAAAGQSYAVNVTGLDATEGSLSASTLLLNQANNWSASFSVTGRGDRDADGNVAYTLQVGGAGVTGTSVTVTNASNDLAPSSIGNGVTPDGRRLPTATNASVTALSADDGSAMRIQEGGAKGSYNLEWRWTFNSLTPSGNYLLQADMTGSEAFRLEWLNGSTWTSLGQGTAFTGNYAVAPTGSSLTVRVTDVAKTSDSARNDVLVDLLTLAPATPPDYLFA